MNVDPFPNINKKLFRRLENYYRDIESEQRGLLGQATQNIDIDLEDPMELLAKMQEEQIFQADLKEIDMAEIFSTLNKDLPHVPEI